MKFTKGIHMESRVVGIETSTLFVILAATIVPGCASDAPAPAISIVAGDLVPDPLFEDDRGFTFRIYFEGDVKPAAGGISVLVSDRYGQAYKQLDGVVQAQPDQTLAAVNVPMLYNVTDRTNPALPAPGPLTVQIWDGAAFDTSRLKDETTVNLTARGVGQSSALAGGGPLSKGLRTIIWGVNPRIDPTDPGLIYQGNVDIWSLQAASTNDTITVEYGDFNGALNTQFASVYLRDSANGAYVASNTTRTAGRPTNLTVPTAGDYFLYIVHDPTQWNTGVEYRIAWN
jgi:hypothetical protein